MKLPALLEAWRRRRRGKRRRAAARRRLREVFSTPGRLEGTSLRPEHRARADLLDFDWDEEFDRPVAVRFGILRHPRPHAFSRQFHEVIEYWEVDLLRETPPRRVKGVNLSRKRGGDGEPSGRGTGI